MNLKWRIFALTLGGIFLSGLLISFRAHLVLKDFEDHHKQQYRLSQTQWASENIFTIVQTLESASKGLDRSTVATLERFGVDYFAHAYGKGDSWKFAPRTLANVSKNQIKKQLKEIPFENLSEGQRNWVVTDDHFLLISPVQFIGSEKMNSGFAVYGIQKTKFNDWIPERQNVEVFALLKEKVQNFQKLTYKNATLRKLIGINADGSSAPLSLSIEGTQVSPSFHPGLQLWLASKTVPVARTFWWGPLAKVFYLGLLALGLLSYLLFQKFFNFNIGRETGPVDSDRNNDSSLLHAVVQRLQGDLVELKSTVSEMPEPLLKTDVIQSIDVTRKWLGDAPSLRREIKDFGFMIDMVLNIKEDLIENAGIQLETHIEEGVQAHCSVEAVEDFLLRLVENSVDNLKRENIKKIRVELVKKGKRAQLIYSDTRSSGFPDKNLNHQVLSMKNPLDNIHGLLTFGRLIFQEEIQWDSKPFSLSVKLSEEPAMTVMPPLPVRAAAAGASEVETEFFEIDGEVDQSALEILQPLEISGDQNLHSFSETPETKGDSESHNKPKSKLEASTDNKKEVATDLEEKKIFENSINQDLVDSTTDKDSTEGEKLDLEPYQEESKAKVIDDVLGDFKMEEFQFTNLKEIPPLPPLGDSETKSIVTAADEMSKGTGALKEVTAGKLKLKIREPKKGKPNVPRT